MDLKILVSSLTQAIPKYSMKTLWLSLLFVIAIKETYSEIIGVGDVHVPESSPIFSNRKSIIGAPGDQLTLHCFVLFKNKTEVKEFFWEKDAKIIGSSIRSSNDSLIRARVLNNGTLQLNNLTLGNSEQSSDRGFYRCGARNHAGVVLGPTFQLEVAELRVIVNNTKVKTKEGRPAVLECQIYSSPPLSSSHVDWEKNGESISSFTKSHFEHRKLSLGHLFISNLSQSDSGVYRCTAWNAFIKKPVWMEVELEVMSSDDEINAEPPKFLSTGNPFEPSVIVLHANESRTIDCLASGIQLPNITWVLTKPPSRQYNDQSLTNAHPSRADESEIVRKGDIAYSAITLTPSNSQGIGIYSCIANNGVGPYISKETLVFRMPLLIQQPLSLQVPAAKTARFQCPSISSDHFDIIWYKNGKPIGTFDRVKPSEGEIIISGIILQDSGYYQCEITRNGVSYEIGTARLVVKKPEVVPNAPTDLSCQSGSRKITVNWTTPNTRDLKAFTVHYTSQGEKERQQVTPDSQRSFDITKLKPYTVYSIYIRSYSGTSASAQSVKIQCQTSEEAPTGPPKLFFSQTGPLNQVRIFWDTLPLDVARGKILYYKVQWKKTEEESINIRYLDGNATEYLIRGLEPVSYEARVIPRNSVGWPRLSESLDWHLIVPSEPSIQDEDYLGYNNDTTTTATADESAWEWQEPDLQLMPFSTNSSQLCVTVSWNEFSISNDSSVPLESPVLGYLLTLSAWSENLDDYVTFAPIILESPQTSYNFTTFDYESRYTVDVQAFGTTWESEVLSKTIHTPSSNHSMEEDTLNNATLPGIDFVIAKPVGSSEILVNWTEVELSQNVQEVSYIVFYNEVYEKGIVDSIKSSKSSLLVGGLKPFTAYEFRIFLESSDGPGRFSHKVEARTLAGIPGRPQYLEWHLKNRTSIKIEWKPPSSKRGKIKEYEVQYAVKQEHDPSLNSSDEGEPEWMVQRTSKTSIVLYNLLVNVPYIVKVKARTGGGWGEPSSPLTVSIRNVNSSREDHFVDSNSTAVGLVRTHYDQFFGIVTGAAIFLIVILIFVLLVIFRKKIFPLITTPVMSVIGAGRNNYPGGNVRKEYMECSTRDIEMGRLNGASPLENKSLCNGQNGVIHDPLLPPNTEEIVKPA